jgi:hypothetical protein
VSQDPFAVPNPLVLFAVVSLSAAGFVALLAYARLTLKRARGPEPAPGAVWRCVAALVAAVALGVYIWGALHLVMDESAADQACKTAVGPAHAATVDAYRTSLVPLRFGCHVAGAGTVEGAIPRHVNSVLAIAAILAGAMTLIALFVSAHHKSPDQASTGN